MGDNTFESREGLLKELGIRYSVEQEYRPKNPPRSPHPIRVFKGVDLPLTPEDWCQLCMVEGDYYVGGCCGAMSHLQDLVNHVFRFDSGWITTDRLEEMALCIIDHGDFAGIPFETDKPVEDLVAEAKANWDECDPWDRIALCWHLVKDHHAPEIPRAYGNHLSEIDKSIATLSHGLSALSWDHLFKDKQPPNSQRRVNRTHLLHRMLPALKTLVEGVRDLDYGPVDGFALIDKEKGDEAIATNGYGLCIVETQEEVDKLLGLWKRQQEEYEVQERKDIDSVIGVRRVRVSLENGVEFLQ